MLEVYGFSNRVQHAPVGARRLVAEQLGAMIGSVAISATGISGDAVQIAKNAYCAVEAAGKERGYRIDNSRGMRSGIIRRRAYFCLASDRPARVVSGGIVPAPVPEA